MVGDTNIVGGMSVEHDAVPAYSGEMIGNVVVSTKWENGKKKLKSIFNYFPV